MRPIKIKAKTAAGASAIYRELRDESGEGASTYPCGEWNGHHISYNGRVWEAGKPEGERKAIYNPGGGTPDIWKHSTKGGGSMRDFKTINIHVYWVGGDTGYSAWVDVKGDPEDIAVFHAGYSVDLDDAIARADQLQSNLVRAFNLCGVKLDRLAPYIRTKEQMA